MNANSLSFMETRLKYNCSSQLGLPLHDLCFLLKGGVYKLTEYAHLIKIIGGGLYVSVDKGKCIEVDGLSISDDGDEGCHNL